MTDNNQHQSVPFTEDLCVGRDALPDANYPAALDRIEQQQGTKFQSDELQTKAVFVFRVLSGEHQGEEAWAYCNLPDIGPDGRRKRLSPKSRLYELVTQLRGGKSLGDGETFSPSLLIGTTGFVSISDGKVAGFMRMDLPQPQAATQDAYEDPYAEPVDQAAAQASNNEAAAQAKETI